MKTRGIASKKLNGLLRGLHDKYVGKRVWYADYHPDGTSSRSGIVTEIGYNEEIEDCGEFSEEIHISVNHKEYSWHMLRERDILYVEVCTREELLTHHDEKVRRLAL